MRKLLVCCAALALVAGLAFVLHHPGQTEAAAAGGALLVHDVYFKLKDSSPAGRQKLVDACKKYLSKHPGTVYFAAGTLAEELKREVNDRDWDVGLHIVFKDTASHDKYQDAPLHKQFIDENKDGWEKVRVFDTRTEQ